MNVKSALPVLLSLLAAGGAAWLLLTGGSTGSSVEEGRGIEHRGAGPSQPDMLRAERLETPPVGIMGKDAVPAARRDERWMTAKLRFPDALERLTGAALVREVSKHMPIRYANEAERRAVEAFEFHEDLDPSQLHAEALMALAADAGFDVHLRSSFLFLRRVDRSPR